MLQLLGANNKIPKANLCHAAVCGLQLLNVTDTFHKMSALHTGKNKKSDMVSRRGKNRSLDNQRGKFTEKYVVMSLALMKTRPTSLTFCLATAYLALSHRQIWSAVINVSLCSSLVYVELICGLASVTQDHKKTLANALKTFVYEGNRGTNGHVLHQQQICGFVTVHPDTRSASMRNSFTLLLRRWVAFYFAVLYDNGARQYLSFMCQ